MELLQKVFNEELTKAMSFKVIGAKIIARKLEKLGINLSDEQRDKLETLLENAEGKTESLIELDDIIGESRDINLDLDEGDEFDEISKELREKIELMIPEIIDSSSDELLENLIKSSDQIISIHRDDKNSFEDRLLIHWGDALNLLELLIITATDIGAKFNQHFRPKAITEKNLVFEALTRLHARSCQVANEVLILLKAGYADGAHARWRTLHEISVVAWFIKDKGNDVAERYLLHEAIESVKAARQHQRYASRINEIPPTQKEFDALLARQQQLRTRFGPDYLNNYGWASIALGISNPTFNNIEEAVNLDHLRPYYKLASHSVHANPKGILFSLGLHRGKPNVLLAGASDMGLADPGQGTAISLNNVTTALLVTELNLDCLVNCKLITKLKQEVIDAFITAHHELHKQKVTRHRRRKPKLFRRK